jgi:AMP phosphorylase
MKIHHKEDAENLARKFKYLANRFDIKLNTIISHASQPAGHGVGPLLEAKDALKVLEQREDRPLDLEEKSVGLASELIELCLEDSKDDVKEKAKEFGTTKNWAQQILKAGLAHKKMLEIIEAQNGDAGIESEKLNAGPMSKRVKSERSGDVESINSKNITIIAKILGAPHDRRAGIYLNKRVSDKVQKGEELFEVYAEGEHRLTEAIHSLDMFPIYEIE